MLGFPVALLSVNAFEWYAHKVWLHELPKMLRPLMKAVVI